MPNEDIQSLGFDPARVKVVLISHEHQNKIGVLESVLNDVKNGTKVYIPGDFKLASNKGYMEIRFVVNDTYRF